MSQKVIQLTFLTFDKLGLTLLKTNQRSVKLTEWLFVTQRE